MALRHLLGSARTLTLVDQGISSLTNFAAGLYAARTLSPNDFGVFALLTFVYILVLGATRASMSDVAMVTRTPAARGHGVDLGATDAVTTVVMGTGIMCACMVAPSQGLPGALAVLGIVLMAIQDSTRIVSIASDRPRHAVVNDSLWFVALLAGLVLIQFTTTPTAWIVMATWGLSATPGLLAGGLFTGWRWSIARGTRFLRSNARLSASFFGDWTLKQGTAQVATYGMGLLGGLTAVAGIRAGLLVLGPLNIAFTGLQLAAMPAAVRLRNTDLARMRQILRWLSMTLGGVALAAGALFAMLPDDVLRVLVGEQAAGLSRYVLPLAVNLAATGLASGSHVGLRTLQFGGRLVATRSVSSLLYIAGGVVAFLATGSVAGGLWGLAIGGLLGVLIWERAFLGALIAARSRLGSREAADRLDDERQGTDSSPPHRG